ncbi:hypothetical protein SAMN02910369_01124 [Lachnospiraceae bacterium NE2001]|nr:hypothetical protein SAMN02910369_01124 [Lachnospiraceae bacterium NE2001]
MFTYTLTKLNNSRIDVNISALPESDGQGSKCMRAYKISGDFSIYGTYRPKWL